MRLRRRHNSKSDIIKGQSHDFDLTLFWFGE